ncbi:MAG: DUF4270 family protein [Bacteroidales bacterium]|nr:DUF4270 family protein [Bacteroidales bacterium]
MKRKIKLSQILTGISVLSIFLLFNCEEKPLEAGLDILPSDELIDVIVDTFGVELYTITDEAVYTRSIGISPLGSVNDSVTGILQTEFITDFIYSDDISFLDADREDVILLDLKIYLSFLDSYGDSMDVDFDVYELTEPMPDYGYSDYTMFDHMYDHEPLNVSEPYKLRDDTSVYVMDIADDFAERLIAANWYGDSTLYVSDYQRNFKDYFKGMYFATESRASEGGGIIMVDHYHSSMVLRTLEYNSDSAKWDTLANVFYLGNPESEIDTGGVHLNLYHTENSPNVETVNNNFSKLYKRAYINALAGPQVLVRIPELERLREEYEGEISVNFAHLIIPFEEATFLRDTARYRAPANLGLHDSLTNEPILDDELAVDHLGGKLDSTEFQYRFNIGNHVHTYLRSSESSYSNSFYLFAASGSPVTRFRYTPARVVLQQDSVSGRYPRVRIVYSIIPK